MDTERIKILFRLTIVIFFLILFRVAYLQFFDQELKKRSLSNKVRKEIIEPSRGLILDRNGEVLVDNQHSYNIYVVPYRFLNSQRSIELISQLLKIKKDSIIMELTSENIVKDRYYILARNIDLNIYMNISEREKEFRGISLRREWKRDFKKITAPHIIGHLGEAISSDDLKRDIVLGDLIGKDGIEFVYDSILRGEKGFKKVLRDVKNKKVSDYDKGNWKKAVKGTDIYLTIDHRLQSYIEKLFEGHSGTIIVEDCRNGEILSMVSKPDFPLEIFSEKMTEKEWNKWSEDPQKPLYNKAIMGRYPPGSVIKMASSLAALKTKIVSIKDKVYCPGGMQIGRRFMKCWLRKGHGNVNMFLAIMMSCDTYFYEIARNIDIDQWKKYLLDLGFGRKTGVDLTFEKTSEIPDEEYYRNRKIKGNLVGRYANLMIGQGEILVTPLQVANYTCILANGGIRYTPHLFYRSEDGKIFSDVNINSTDTININLHSLNHVRSAMFNVVNVEGGTAFGSRSSIVQFAGKTGTAQNPHGGDHAWFTSYAPYKKPEIVVTVFEEHGLHGSGAARYAKKIIEYWYQNIREND